MFPLIRSDQQLHQWLGDLESAIRNSPLGERLDVEDLSGIEGAIAEGEEATRRLGTDGARSQVQYLEDQRQQLLAQIDRRREWVEDHADLLQTYTAIKDELAARSTALAISYQLRSPADVLESTRTTTLKSPRRQAMGPGSHSSCSSPDEARPFG
ncbi:MAG: hypothetical protein ACRDWA_04830 [Acidimicrobiia bacterium]